MPFAVGASHAFNGQAILHQIAVAGSDGVDRLELARLVACGPNGGREHRIARWFFHRQEGLTSAKVRLHITGSSLAECLLDVMLTTRARHAVHTHAEAPVVGGFLHRRPLQLIVERPSGEICTVPRGRVRRVKLARPDRQRRLEPAVARVVDRTAYRRRDPPRALGGGPYGEAL